MNCRLLSFSMGDVESDSLRTYKGTLATSIKIAEYVQLFIIPLTHEFHLNIVTYMRFP
jgi:hypothetical protein